MIFCENSANLPGHVGEGEKVLFARVNGVVLHHERAGLAEGPALVFANALGTDLRIWDDVAARLAPAYRILRYDKRGHGLSETTPAPYSLSDHVGDLAALLDACGIARAVVVGLSAGGMVAQGLAAARPDLVKALVLAGTAPRIGTEASWNARIAAVAEHGTAGIADTVLKGWFTPRFRDGNPDFVGYRAMLERSPVEGYVGTAAALRDADLTQSTRALAIPVIALAGDADGSTPPDLVRAMAAIVPGADFRLIADAGHICCVEQPDEVAGVIRGFLTEIGYAGRMT